MRRSLPILLALLLFLMPATPAEAQFQDGPNLNGSTLLDVDPDRVDPGGTITFEIGVSNDGTEDAPPFEAAFYLSDDPFLSPDDLLLDRQAFPGLSSEGIGGIVVSGSATVPTGFDEGEYNVIFSVDDPDVVEESFSPNFNERDNLAADAFTVGGAPSGPDLTFSFPGPELEDEEAAPGENISVEYTIDNQGDADSGDFEIGYYVTPAGFFSRKRAVLAERETIGGVDAGDEEDESEQVSVPAGLPPDSYGFVIVLDDARQISEEDEVNNFSGVNAVDVLAEPGGTQPDLTVGGRPSTFVNFSYANSIVSPAVGPAADTVAIAYKLSNRGDASISASSVEVGYYLSTDSTFSESEDVRFGTTTVGTYEDTEVPAEPGAETYVEVQEQLPPEDALPAGFGDYLVLIVADPSGQISESDESNNTGRPQSRAVLRSAEVAAGETGTFSPPGADIGVSAEVTQNTDDTGGGHLLFRRLEGTAPQSTFDGSTAEAPDGTTVTPDRTPPVRWAITGSMLTETSFRPRIDTMGVPGIEDPDRLLVVGRKKSEEAWEPFDTGRTGSTLTGSERDPVWGVPSSVFTIGGEQSENPLPVELASFTARADGEQAAVLEWRTASETGNDGFRIERRRPNADVGATGRSPGEWTRVAFVGSKAEGGTSSEPLAYQYRAEDLDYGQHTFRLVQRDLSGGETPVGSEQSVEIGLSGAYDLSEASPNPIREQGSFALTVREAQNVSVSVYDALGRRVRVLREGRVAAQETERLTLEAGDLASGVYFVRVVGEAFAATRRAVVVR